MSAVPESAGTLPFRPAGRPTGGRVRRGRARKVRSGRLAAVLPLAFALAMLLIWQGLVRSLHVPPYVLPAPSDFLSVLVERIGPISTMAWQTLKTALLGFILGVSIGLVTGAVIGSSRAVYETVYPSLVGFQAIPIVAFIPLLVVWFSVGPHIAVITSTMVSFFPVTVIVSTAIAASSPELDDVLRSLGARRIDVLLKVSIPRAMPQFFGSIKLAVTGAFIGTIVAETVAANSGVGYLMVVATNGMDAPLAFAGLAVLATMGVVLYAASVFLEKRLTGWAYRRE